MSASPGATLRWRPTFLLAVVGGSVLAAAALAIRSDVLLFLAFPLLLAPVAGLFEAPPSGIEATVTWTAGGGSGEVAVRGTVELPTGVASGAVDLTFYRPGPLCEDRPPRLERRPGAIDFELAWRAPFPCVATAPRPEVVWRDRLGTLERRLATRGPTLRVERFPPELLRLGTVHLRRTAPVPGEVRSRAVGASGEFFGIRPFGPSDTPRQVNWRASARAGHLLANDFRLERTGDLLLLLDLRPTSLGPARDREILAIERAAALGIAEGFLAEKARVGLGLFDEFLTAVPLGTGRVHRYRLERALDRAALGTDPGPSERFAVSLRRFFPTGVTTVLLSSLADDEAVRLLGFLRRRGFPTVVLSPSPLPLLAPAPGLATSDDALAMRLLELVRRRRIADVWEEAPVVDWTDYWSLAGFARFLATPVRSGRGIA